MIQIRALTTADLALGMRLKDQAGWNQTEADWRRFLALEPDGCFVAELDGEPVGTTTTCIFETVGWVAMVLVDERARHQGLGTRLVQHAVAYLKQRGVHTVRLDATALGRPVYERLGFAAEYELVRLQGTAPPAGASTAVTIATGRDLDSLAALDLRVTGTNRRRFLDRLFGEQPERAGQVIVAGELQGYVMLRSGTRATQIGPAVAVSADAGRQLLQWAVSCCAGRAIFVDVPSDNRAAVEWLVASGLTPQRTFTRMYHDRPHWDRADQIWASSGPEKG